MNRDTFNDLRSILERIKRYKTEIRDLESKLKVKSTIKLISFLSPDDFDKKTFRLFKRESKQEIKARKENISELESFLDDVCTFDFDVATSFIAEALKLFYKQYYYVTKLELEYFHLLGKIPVTDYEDVSLIAPKRNTQLVSKMYSEGKLETSDDIHSIILDDDYVLLDTRNKYKFFDYNKKKFPKSIIGTFPHLEVAIIDLIDNRISNPKLSEEQLVAMTLSELPIKYSDLINGSDERTK